MSGSQIEQLVDELILLANIMGADPARLPLPDHVHLMKVNQRRPSGCSCGLQSRLRELARAAAALRLS